jgi:hypothetical protein
MYPLRLRALRPAVTFLAVLAIAIEVAWLIVAGVRWLV